MGVEELLVDALGALPDFQALAGPGQGRIEAFMDVPANRPVRFVTVERTSGAEANLVDRPVLAVQCWAESRHAAAHMAEQLAQLLDALPATAPRLGRCKTQSIYNFPDARQARYQLTVAASTVRG